MAAQVFHVDDADFERVDVHYKIPDDSMGHSWITVSVTHEGVIIEAFQNNESMGSDHATFEDRWTELTS